MVVFRREHFHRIEDINVAKSLFKSSVATVEIEIFSFCNRTCAFCGNSKINRRGANVFMDGKLYSKILDDLSEISYDGIIWYSRYNEPTSDRVFLERLREARVKLPRARLQTFTNGDYLTAEYIFEIRDAGLNELRIMAYLPNTTEPTPANFLNTMVHRLKALGLPWQFFDQCAVRIDVPGIDVTMRYINLLQSGTDRGGALKTGHIIQRESPCTIPTTSVYVDYNGSMVPCCDIRSDYEEHRNCVVFNLTPQNSIFEGYANSELVRWRRSLVRFGPKEFPCNSCSRGVFPQTPELTGVFAKVAEVADAQ